MGKVVVIGTGTMGVGISAGFLAYGTDVVILGCASIKAEACLEQIKACAQSINPEWSSLSPTLIAGSISDWKDWNDTDLVIETISERLDLKREIFSDLDQRVPSHIPIGSNSSGFPISDITDGLHTSCQPILSH